MGRGHNGTGAQWDGDTMGRGHNEDRPFANLFEYLDLIKSVLATEILDCQNKTKQNKSKNKQQKTLNQL